GDRAASLTLSEEQLAIGKRQVESGAAYLRKTVETEHVRQTVPVQHEELRVERHPLSADAATDVQIGADEIRIPLVREELVVEKRAVPVEEVVLRKDVVTEERVVEADLRRERLDDSQLNATSRDRDDDSSTRRR
ncbi:MAG TPA: YsnF/AvaK domain-containing protein, partial [Gemmatimonadaceae bacterium]|nr:YsnF/AvaK domain-containing protein [Gemmatimonadaceae bacterium]